MLCPYYTIAKACVTYQHSGSEVEFVKELSDEDVGLHEVLLVSFLNITDDLREPLPLLLSTGHPDEEHLKKQMVDVHNKN